MLSDLVIVLGIFVVLFLALVIMAYRSQKTKTSPDELRAAAERGDVVAQFELARQLNGTEAFDWYLQAARQDHIRAQLIVAEAYLAGRDCPLSQTEACRWLERAAELGADEARERLASLLPETVEDAPEAAPSDEIASLASAAQAGDPESQYQLGIVYYHGEGAAKDLAQALGWFKLAAEQGDAEAQFNLGLMYGRGEGTAKDINQSVEWFRKAAEQGHAAATDILQKMIK